MIRYARVCRVATVGPTGVPHCVPICPLYDDKKIYFGSAKRGRKVSHILRDPHLALVFDDYSETWSGLRGIAIVGACALIDHGPRFRKIRHWLYSKYPQYEQEAALDEKKSWIVEVVPRRSFSWGF